MSTDPRVFLFDAAGSPSLAARIRGAIGAAARIEDLRGSATTPAAAVGVFPAGSIDQVRSFVERLSDPRIPLLTVASGASAAWIGPLTVRGAPPCWRCAHDRMMAAAAARGESAIDKPARLGARAQSILVRELRTLLREGPSASMLTGHILEVPKRGPATLHKLVPLAFCEVCGGAAAADTAADPFCLGREPEEILEALAGWVDVRTGVITRLVLDASEPVWVATAAPPFVLENGHAARRLPVGWGKGVTPGDAILSAVGEAVERYSASLPDPRRVVWRRIDELEGDVLDPRSLPLYSPLQYARDGFPFVPFDAGAVHPWVLGWWYGSGTPVWLPAILVYLALDVRRENLFCQGTSNGLACSTTMEDAARRAVLELLERDALLAAWWTGAPGAPAQPPLIRERMESLGAKVEAYYLPTAACGSAAICLALGDGSSYPAVTLALGCDLDPERALHQAALELAQTGPHLARQMRSGALRIPQRPEQVREMLDHAAFYFAPGRQRAFDRLRTGTARHPAAARIGLAHALEAAGIRVAIADVTAPDVATGPFRVVRAISPDLQPVTFGYGLDREPVTRIRDLCLAREIPPVHPIW